MKFEKNEKFALISLNRVNIHHALPDSLNLSKGFFACRKLPGIPDKHWREWLGSIKFERLEKANLYLGCKAASATPEILDGENQQLQQKVYAFYRAVFLTDYIIIRECPLYLTGSMLESGLDVRSVGDIQQPFSVPGTPLSLEINEQKLEQAAQLASSITLIFEESGYSRFKRVIYAFETGVNAPYANERLHQFVRCVEGLIYPERGKSQKRFKSRTELFIGSKLQELMGELYDLRGSEEHMNEVQDILALPNIREKRVILFQRAFEAEGLARYCIAHFLSNKSLWPHFMDDQALSSFWKLNSKERQAIWGEPLDMEAISNRFESQWIEQEYIE